MICYNCGWQNPGGRDRCEKCGEVLRGGEPFENEYGEEGEPDEEYVAGKEMDVSDEPEWETGEVTRSGVTGGFEEKEKVGEGPDFLREEEMFYYKYALKRRLNRDVLGEVWLATDIDTEQKVALRITTSPNSADRDRAKEEFLLLRSLHHRHIVRPDFFGVYKDLPFYVMPYYEGGCASQLLGRVHIATVRQFLRDVASGLACLHARGIVHGDVRPDHVLIDDEGRFILCGFGCSMNKNAVMHRNGSVEGSLAYMSPELFGSQPSNDTPRDIWALGVSLYELITGKLPFDGMGGRMQKQGAEVSANFHSYLKVSERHDRENYIKEEDCIMALSYFYFQCMDENPLARIKAEELCFWEGLKSFIRSICGNMGWLNPMAGLLLIIFTIRLIISGLDVSLVLARSGVVTLSIDPFF